MIKIISEIGINHNGSLDLAKKLIDLSAIVGCDYVKFQKRNPELSVPKDQRDKIRTNTPWGDISYIDYKYKVEFQKDEFDEIDKYCHQRKIKWFASAWDTDSADFLKNYGDLVKIPSAKITDFELLSKCKIFDNRIISTGMSSEDQIEKSVEYFQPNVIMHTLSTYPAPVEELNLNYILHLKKKYQKAEIGYSGHEFGLPTTFAAVALGSTWVERHVTLDRTMWGSDQMASIEPVGLFKLVEGIRQIEKSLGESKDREISKSELLKLNSLRGK